MQNEIEAERRNRTVNNFVLEVCADSVESVLAAQRGMATRIELCGNLLIGGTTPGICLFQKVREVSDIRIHVLIRPRFGDFCYTDYEFEIIKREVEQFRGLGAEGVVIGILKQDGTLDLERMEILMEAAGTMSVTLHRAFDLCRDPYRAMEQAKMLGIHTILTSGQRNSCREGKELLRELVSMEKGKTDILIGGGVDADVIRDLQPYTKAHAFHMSGKEKIESPMKYRKEGVSMGLPSFDEFTIFRTGEENVRRARTVLEEL